MAHIKWHFIILCTLIISKDVAGKYPNVGQPNIIMIVADDLGWDDISLHGQNQFYTPNIDALGLNGITLNRHYTAPMCTPSRAALMTGRDGYHTGMFNFVIQSDEPWGISLSEKLLPEVLKENGYKTHLVGKWHLGFFKSEYSPVYRGFDTFNGFLGPYIDYWDHSTFHLKRNYARGYDMRDNLDIDPSNNGTYVTDVFTNKAVELITQHDGKKPMFMVLSHLAPHTANNNDPMQAPQSEIDKFSYIKCIKRRTLAAMISKLDFSVGQVVKTLKKRNMLDNTVILFLADNGAQTIGFHSNAGSNHPFKGQKNSPWEGASRVAGVIFSPLLEARQRVSNQYIHITDWFKTLAELGGVDTATVKPNLDGFDVWDALCYNLPSPRTEIIHNIDSVFDYAAFINDSYKYIEGTTSNGIYDSWLGLLPFKTPIEEVVTNYANEIRNSEVGKALLQYLKLSQDNSLSDAKIYRLRQQATVRCTAPPIDEQFVCNPLVSPCLFDIINDPCETRNLATALPIKFKEMQTRLDELRFTAVPSLNKPIDSNSNPALHNNTWTYWQDD